MKRAAVGILLACLLVGPANAAKPRLLYAEFQGGMTNTYELVEQQSCTRTECWHVYGSEGVVCNLDPVPEVAVCNRTVDPEREGSNDPVHCFWDVDDHSQVRWLGDRLGPGQSVSITKCLVADSGHLYGIDNVHGLTMTIAFDLVTGRDFSLTSTSAFCVAGPRVQDWSPHRVEIPDSDGGTGVPATVTWTVTNPTDRAVHFGRTVGIVAGSGHMGMDTYADRHCPEGAPFIHLDGSAGDGGFSDAEGIGYWWDTND